MDLNELSKNVSEIVSTWDKWTGDFIKRFDPDLLDINQEQMMEGENGDGKPIGELQQPEYIKFKRSIGSRAAGKGLADLRVIGDFQDSRYVEHKGDSITIDSKDWKKSRLTKKYGYQIFGIQEKRLDRLIEEQIEPEFIMEIEKKLGI